MPDRLGLFGGTFDPVHVGHVIVAQDVLEELDLDRLLVVPAGRPPHREAVLSPEVRLELTRVAFDGDDRVAVSDVELRRPGPSYTVETLEWAREELEPAELFCLIGEDQLREFSTWREPERVARLSRLAVMTRGGDAGGSEDESGEDPFLRDLDYIRVPVTRVDVSSTLIRDRLRDGLSIRYLVPEPVRAPLERAWEEEARELA